MSDRTALIDRIEAFPAALADVVGQLDAAVLTAHPIAGEWSIAQNVHHVMDSHVNGYIRTKLILAEVGPVLKPYDEADWGELPDAGHADISGSLTTLVALHERWVRLLRALPDEAWQRTGYHPAQGILMSLLDVVELYAEHGEAHLEQLQRNLDAL